MFGCLEQKLLGRLRKSFVFLKSNFYVRENFKFQCDPFSNKKDVSQRSILYFWIFFNETWHCPRNKRYRERILSKICITANVQVNVILHYKTLFQQNMCRNLKFLTAENQTFSRSAQ
jgi:hypothetical protein